MSTTQARLHLAGVLFALAWAGPAAAAGVGAALTTGPFRGADPARGEALYTEMKCAACHAERMMGQASAMYTRSDRKVHDASQLNTFTQGCVTRLNRDLFPEEVRDIAAYLNQTYYHFTK